ncbi:MAG: hypothetical protein ACP6IS_12205 [Candidatus Asgardarchaeia archaeon]
MDLYAERYNKIKNDLDEIIDKSDKYDNAIVTPAIFAHALVLAKMREKKVDFINGAHS